MDIITLKSHDGLDLACRVWKSASPKGSIINLHGIQSHGEWFLSSCRFLADNGYSVYAPDRRGSGLNDACRGDCASFKALLEDVKLVIDLAGREVPGKPVHVIGVSWGGKLAALSALCYPEYLKSLVLAAPGLKQKVDLSAFEKAKVLLSCLFSPKTEFDIPIGDAGMFTSNPAKLAYIRSDGLMLKKATARFFVESLKMGILIEKGAEKIRLPAYMLLAEIDEIVDNAKLITLFGRFGSEKKEFKIYKGAHHTLEFEADTKEFFVDILRWLNKNNG